MASRWRIRHKLMLGQSLVVGIMALLLAGASHGLWSYYLTTMGIRSRLAEVKAAEQLNEAVAALAAAALVENQDRFGQMVREVAKKLNEYEDALQGTLGQGRDPIYGEQQAGLLDVLKKNLEELERPLKKLFDPEVVALAGDEERLAEKRVQIDTLFEPLRRNTRDLRANIYQGLNQRIDGTRAYYQTTIKIVVPASVVGLLVMAWVVRSFYVWVFHPIRDLGAGVERVAGGDFAYRIEVRSGDEMEDLGQAFNDMTRRLQELYGDLSRQVNERSRQLVRSERLASVGFLAAGVAHEINNPLASIAFCSEALESRLADLKRLSRQGAGRGDDLEVFTKYLKMIQDEAFRCKKITERLLAFSRTGERHREQTDLAPLVQSVLDVTQHLPNSRGKHIALEVEGPRGPGGRITAWVNADEIKAVALNLVVNALDSMDEGGKLTIRLGQRDGMAVLTFTDTGCGMPPEVLENIFEPFFTRSRTGKGTGLGLTISHLIITQHGGEIEAASAGVDRGSTFTVRLPVQPVDPPQTAPLPLAA